MGTFDLIGSRRSNDRSGRSQGRGRRSNGVPEIPGRRHPRFWERWRNSLAGSRSRRSRAWKVSWRLRRRGSGNRWRHRRLTWWVHALPVPSRWRFIGLRRLYKISVRPRSSRSRSLAERWWYVMLVSTTLCVTRFANHTIKSFNSSDTGQQEDKCSRFTAGGISSLDSSLKWKNNFVHPFAEL